MLSTNVFGICHILPQEGSGCIGVKKSDGGTSIESSEKCRTQCKASRDGKIGVENDGIFGVDSAEINERKVKRVNGAERLIYINL